MLTIPNSVSEQQILESLHRVPQERSKEVLRHLQTLPSASVPQAAVRTGTDLVGSDLIGIWADFPETADSREFARRLRDEAQHGERRADAAGH